MTTYITLAQKVDLLLQTVKQPNGHRFTYDDIFRKTGIKASTISRIRSGENVDPYFRTIIALAHAFGIRLSFFSTEMSVEEAQRYLESPESTEFLDELRFRQQQEHNDAHHRLVNRISMRATHLDEEGLMAIADMLDYVLKQKGIEVADEEVSNDVISQ